MNVVYSGVITMECIRYGYEEQNNVTHWHKYMGKEPGTDEMAREESLCAKNGQSVSE